MVFFVIFIVFIHFKLGIVHTLHNHWGGLEMTTLHAIATWVHCKSEYRGEGGAKISQKLTTQHANDPLEEKAALFWLPLTLKFRSGVKLSIRCQKWDKIFRI